MLQEFTVNGFKVDELSVLTMMIYIACLFIATLAIQCIPVYVHTHPPKHARTRTDTNLSMKLGCSPVLGLCYRQTDTGTHTNMHAQMYTST